MVNPALLAEVDALSVDELAELVAFIDEKARRDAGTHGNVSEEQEALLRVRRNDPDPTHWHAPDETAALIRELRG